MTEIQCILSSWLSQRTTGLYSPRPFREGLQNAFQYVPPMFFHLLWHKVWHVILIILCFQIPSEYEAGFQIWHCSVLGRRQSNWIFHKLLVGMWNDVDALENMSAISYRIISWQTEKTAQQWREYIALTEDPSSIPRIYKGQLTTICDSSSRDSDVLFWASTWIFTYT